MQRIPEILSKYEPEILSEWGRQLAAATLSKTGAIGEQQLREECREFLNLLRSATQDGNVRTTDGAEWKPVRQFLISLSESRTTKGFSASDTARFVLSLKLPLFDRLRKEMQNDGAGLADEIWKVTLMMDQLSLITTEAAQQAREAVINRQQMEMLELSTPVVKLWDGVLALPLIGTLDSARTQIVMESLLEHIVSQGASIAIIDITGVPTVDTLVAQHLLKTVSAARLMGAECIISGIRPQIAQTIVHLGVVLGDVTTKATLADAFKLALMRSGLGVVQMPRS